MDASDYRAFTRISLLGKRPRASQPSQQPQGYPYASSTAASSNMPYAYASYSSLFSKPQPTADSGLLIRFYDPSQCAPDARGRPLRDILAWEDPRLEGCHNYIQMLFPLPEGSPFNLDAPIVDREVFEAFRSREELRAGLRGSFERMLAFYGFELRVGGEGGEADGFGEEGEEGEEGVGRVRVVLGPNYREAFANWVHRFDHNHLRISRILRSLRVLGLPDEAQAFFHALQEVFDSFGRISERSLMFWRRAAERPLWIAPDDERVLWLKDFEEREEMEKVKTAVEIDDGGRDVSGNEAGQNDQEQTEVGKGKEHAAVKETNLRKIQKLDEVGKANVEGDEAEDLLGKETRDMDRERDEIKDGIIGEVKAENEERCDLSDPTSVLGSVGERVR
jgi:hypothetical protein